jgi:hypothetical protein
MTEPRASHPESPGPGSLGDDLPKARDKDVTHETKQSLWRLTAAPLLWAAHFLLSYGTAAIFCAKIAGRGGSLGSVRVAIAVYTAVALAGIAIIGWTGYQRHIYGDEDVVQDADTPLARHRFLGSATLLLAALSAVATLYAALTIVFIRTCD